MISMVRGKNKEKRAKRKNSVKKQGPNRKKKRCDKETENSVAGSRTRFICTVTHLISKNNFVISKEFFSAIDAV